MSIPIPVYCSSGATCYSQCPSLLCAMEYPVWRVLCVMLFLSFDKGNVHALKMSVFNGALTSVCVLPMYVYTLYILVVVLLHM